MSATTASNNTLSSVSDNSSSSAFDCVMSSIGISIIIAFLITKIFVTLCLSILILYVAYQRWQRESLATTSHSDIFTYNVTAIELIFVLGATAFLCGVYTNNSVLLQFGMYPISIVFPGEIFFNTVTCVERYLAVVHPITYMGLRQSGGVRIRNICIGCVWLLCFIWIGVTALYYPNVPYVPFFSVMAASLIIVSFCSLSVLCVLIRPGPGEMGANREKIDHSKQKAFYTITAIMIVLLVCFLGMLVTIGLHNSNLLRNTDRCVILLSYNWFNLPMSLILPLLFLHRAGKISCSCFSKN